MLTKSKILLADDHRIVREGIKHMIDRFPHIQVSGECENTKQLLEDAKLLQPDLILLDVSMPNSRCAETIRFLRRDCPNTKILILTMHSELAYLNLCLQAGASGYVLKASSQEDLIHAINTVLKGGVYIDPQLALELAGSLRKTQESVSNVAAKTLSDRESEILRLIARGETNKDIAELIGISEKSVETYKSRAMEKLGMSKRNELLRFALAQGWLDNL